MEYKPSINSIFYLIDVSHLAELTLQGYYCMRYYELPSCLHCLTDMVHFHYFRLNCNNGKFECHRLFKISYKDHVPSTDEVKHHLQCLLPLILNGPEHSLVIQILLQEKHDHGRFFVSKIVTA